MVGAKSDSQQNMNLAGEQHICGNKQFINRKSTIMTSTACHLTLHSTSILPMFSITYYLARCGIVYSLEHVQCSQM